MQWFYLHGWGSSPEAHKITQFRQRYGENRLIAQQLANLTTCVEEESMIIGASFGGLLGLWLAQHLPQVQKLLLLAPALDLNGIIQQRLGIMGLWYWRIFRTIPVYHATYASNAPLHYDFYHDLQRYPDHALTRRLPTLIIHGISDTVVPIAHSRNFVRTREWITLQEVRSNHALGDLSAEVWQQIDDFLLK